MKRIQMCKKVDTNNSFNHFNRKLNHLNAVSPEILVGQIWLQDESTGVEIIELNTSDEFDLSTDKALDNSLDHAWSFTKNDDLEQIKDNYKINRLARERRRLNHEIHYHTTNTATNTNNDFINNNVYSGIGGNPYIEERQLVNHQVNCFTMINKNFVNSDTSSDADIDVITTDDLTMEPNNWDASNDPYEEEIVTYDPESDEGTRTIWIYSFKNKHLLAEDDYELAETASKEVSFCSTSSSTESDEIITKDKRTNIRRLGSPIPTFIPRLNLGTTLSTVSEVSEPKKRTSPNQSYKSPKTRFQKQRNSWVMTETERLDTTTSDHKHEKSTNIVNWMALSPREKRRRSPQEGDKWVGSLLKLETLPIDECNQQQTQVESEQDNALRLQVDVDVHVSVNEKTPEKRSLGTPNSANVTLKSNNDKKSPIVDLLNCAPVEEKDDMLDRGDHTKFGQTQQVLCISGPSHIYESIRFSEHINMRRVGNLTFVEEREMKIDPDAWDREQKEEIETASYDYLTDQLKISKANPDLAWMKNNAPFLAPSKWDNYAEVVERPLSIEVSIPSAATDREPWYKRFFKTINCFK